MKIDVTKQDAKASLVISADEADMQEIKKLTLIRMQPEVSAPGFRKGKAPLNVVEKQVDENYLQTQFLDEAVNELYRKALQQEKLRPVAHPEVDIKAFVPFTQLELNISVDVVPPITLADYKKIKKTKSTDKVGKKDVDEVLANLQTRMAEKTEIEREAKDGDEVWIDFDGKDAKGEAVAGASGKEYPLLLGSNTFIKGFEPELVGLKAGDDKEFTVTFPKDYNHKPLANKKVTFAVHVRSVKEVSKPELDDTFAGKAGPFKSLDALKKDIEKQLQAEKEKEADAKLRDEVIEAVVEGSKVTAPESLVEDQIQNLLNDFKQNLTYRGITFDEYLEQGKLTAEQYTEQELKPQAERRVKTGLVLNEVADAEKIEVTPEELEIRMQLLKGQYNDETMQAQLNTAEARRDIVSRLMTEKTVDALVGYATKK